MQARPPLVNATVPILAVLVHVPEVQAAIAWYECALPSAMRRRTAALVPLEYLEIGSVMLEIVPADKKVADAPAGSVVYWNIEPPRDSSWFQPRLGPAGASALVPDI